MNSGEGGAMADRLVKELNENEPGPYQNALTSLLELVISYPNVKSILVLCQNVLEDRHQYDSKRVEQQNRMSKVQFQIQHLEGVRKAQTHIEGNCF
jgi:hypothetical protein